MNIIEAIKSKQARLRELETLMADSGALLDPKKYAQLTSEYSVLRDLTGEAEAYEKTCREIETTKEMVNSNDPEVRAMAEEELEKLKAKKQKLESSLEETLNPSDPLDSKNIIVEIRAGAGGDESSLFSGELFRMYSLYAAAQDWKTTLLSTSPNPVGGYKEVIFEVTGRNVYSKLKWESGVHRVQRVPETEKSGRVHTSTVTVAVLPKLEEIDFALDSKDLKIIASTAGGHGGQSVNTTYSAIRMTHIPTGITVSCQDERSQQQNRERALEIMRSRVFEFYEEKRRREHAEARKAQIGTGDRSEKIRTYNFPQDRITDHRITESWHNITTIMDGRLEPVIEKLKAAERALLD